MITASFKEYQLQFVIPVRTSRGIMDYKHGYFITLQEGTHQGIGECSFIERLSRDNLKEIENKLQEVCDSINHWEETKEEVYTQFPCIVFAIEMALLDLKNGGKKILFESNFTKGQEAIPINGLVWMGDKDFMLQQIKTKAEQGFRCIKIKVGTIDFGQECSLTEYIRSQYDESQMEIRLDANGAFTATDVFEKLKRLSQYNIHSIEQPVKHRQWDLMKEVCAQNIIPVALDEELIYCVQRSEKQHMLDYIHPSYIILKPSLLGGFAKSEEWIALADERNINWWATSALESNIGLNAIAQWAFVQNKHLVQGLGTGGLYTNNIQSPLVVRKDALWYDPSLTWQNPEDAGH